MDGDGEINMKDLVNVLQNKYPGLSKYAVQPVVELSPKVQARVDALKELQARHDELEAKFLEEKAVLEAKYQKLYEPLYIKRSEIVTGVVEPKGAANENDAEKGEYGAEEEKGIPDFWLNALKAHPLLCEEITERDEGALKYLKDIRWCKIDEPKGFKLEFFFDLNPYFKNTILTKIYHMVDEDEPILEKAIGTEIEWLPGKCLTQKLLKKKPKKGSKNSKPVTKLEDCESFFNFFKPPEVPDDDDLDEDAAEELQGQMEQDYDIGSTIRDKIIPRAVSYFTGEADVEDGFGFSDGEDDDEDVDDDEDEEVDETEDDSEEEGAQSKKKAGGKTRKGVKVPEGEQPPECKQQ